MVLVQGDSCLVITCIALYKRQIPQVGDGNEQRFLIYLFLNMGYVYEFNFFSSPKLFLIFMELVDQWIIMNLFLSILEDGLVSELARQS